MQRQIRHRSRPAGRRRSDGLPGDRMSTLVRAGRGGDVNAVDPLTPGRQRRGRAKELKAAVAAGDPAAIARVLAAHPELAGRTAAELAAAPRFALRDAQATIARELGFAGWGALVTAAGDPLAGRPQHLATGLTRIGRRAFEQAQRRGEVAARAPHVVLALLDPPQPTVAGAVLHELGLDHASVAARTPRFDGGQADQARRSTTSTPALHQLDALAQGLALAEGLAEPADHHALLALLYAEPRQGSALVDLDVDPDEVYEALRRRGVTVPPFRPPAVPLGPGPHGPRLYVLDADARAVRLALLEQHPPPRGAMWGLNVSRWRPGWIWFTAEDVIDLGAIARRALGETADVLLVPEREAVEAEATAGGS